MNSGRDASVQRMLIAATHKAESHCSTKHHDSLSETAGGENPYSVTKCVLRYENQIVALIIFQVQ
jgi:hypothetical protein